MILRENDNRIDELELTMVENLQLVDCPLVHRFTDGMYIREIFMPAGSLITSKIHNTNHPYTISKGKAMVAIDGSDWQELEAPYTSITQAGTRRVLYIVEDCIWTTYHAIEDAKLEYNELSDIEKENIVEKIESKIIDTHTNYLTNTNIHIEYKNKINNNKLN